MGDIVWTAVASVVCMLCAIGVGLWGIGTGHTGVGTLVVGLGSSAVACALLSLRER